VPPEEPKAAAENYDPQKATADAESTTAGNAAERIKTENNNPPPTPSPDDGKNPNLVESFKVWLRDPHRDKPKWTDIAIVFLTLGISVPWVDAMEGDV
jgi:hypothetical protein